MGAACAGAPVPTLADNLLNHFHMTSLMYYHEVLGNETAALGVPYVIGETNSISVSTAIRFFPKTSPRATLPQPSAYSVYVISVRAWRAFPTSSAPQSGASTTSSTAPLPPKSPACISTMARLTATPPGSQPP